MCVFHNIVKATFTSLENTLEFVGYHMYNNVTKSFLGRCLKIYRI